MDTEPLPPTTTSQRQTIWQPITLEVALRLNALPSHRQIDGPQRIPPALLRPFETGRQGILLLIATPQERLPTKIAELGETVVVADTDTSTLGRKPGEQVVAVFPTPGQSYLNDVSRGGASITCTEPLSPEDWAYRAINIRLTLAGLAVEPADPEVPPMILVVLGVVRQVEVTARVYTLHLRILARLPEACEAYFERLERCDRDAHQSSA